MPKPPTPQDKRTLVDRFFDRVKNNRIAGTIVIVGICLMALASVTDSMQKLSSNLPSLSKTEVQGTWKSGPVDLYGVGPQTMLLTLQELDGGHLTGSVRFYNSEDRPATPEFDVLQGKRVKNSLSFSFEGGVRRTRDSGQTYDPVPETVSGEVSPAGISLVYEREGRAAVPFSVHRVASAPGDGA